MSAKSDIRFQSGLFELFQGFAKRPSSNKRNGSFDRSLSVIYVFLINFVLKPEIASGFTKKILNTDQIVHNMKELIPIAGLLV